jgi:hypothetical protein
MEDTEESGTALTRLDAILRERENEIIAALPLASATSTWKVYPLLNC